MINIPTQILTTERDCCDAAVLFVLLAGLYFFVKMCYYILYILSVNEVEIIKEISERRSIRKYASASVDAEDIRAVLRAGMLSPSAKNRQPWKFYVYSGDSKAALLDNMEKGLIREREGEKTLPGSYNGLPDAFNTLRIMREAPVIIMVENTNGSSPFVPVNADDRVTEICDTLSVGAAVQNILLTAQEMGYGTLWVANTCFAYNELTEFAGISGQLTGAVVLGVPDEKPSARPRKTEDEVIIFR